MNGMVRTDGAMTDRDRADAYKRARHNLSISKKNKEEKECYYSDCLDKMKSRSDVVDRDTADAYNKARQLTIMARNNDYLATRHYKDCLDEFERWHRFFVKEKDN